MVLSAMNVMPVAKLNIRLFFMLSHSLPLSFVTMAREQDFVMPPETYWSLPLQSEWQRTMSGQNMAMSGLTIGVGNTITCLRKACSFHASR
jgi:hypothetical protein